MILIRENVEKQSNDPYEIAELKSQGFVELIAEEDDIAPGVEPAATGEPIESDPIPDDGPAEMVDLGALSYNELKALAKERGVKGAGSLKKADLIEILKG